MLASPHLRHNQPAKQVLRCRKQMAKLLNLSRQSFIVAVASLTWGASHRLRIAPRWAWKSAGSERLSPTCKLISPLHPAELRHSFPSLKRRVIELARQWEPRTLLIEDKGAGTALIQQLRAEANGIA